MWIVMKTEKKNKSVWFCCSTKKKKKEIDNNCSFFHFLSFRHHFWSYSIGLQTHRRISVENWLLSVCRQPICASFTLIHSICCCAIDRNGYNNEHCRNSLRSPLRLAQLFDELIFRQQNISFLTQTKCTCQKPCPWHFSFFFESNTNEKNQMKKEEKRTKYIIKMAIKMKYIYCHDFVCLIHTN